MVDIWKLFLGGTTRDNLSKEFDGNQVAKDILKYTLFALSMPAIYLFLSYLVKAGIW